jgi:hypothetical protein
MYRDVIEQFCDRRRSSNHNPFDSSMLTSSAVIKPRRQPRRVVRHNRGFFQVCRHP